MLLTNLNGLHPSNHPLFRNPIQKHGDLMEILKKERMTDEKTWDITRQVIRGLAYLHHNHIVHGDMKPSNLLVAHDGTVKLSDFGISKITNESNDNDNRDGYIMTEHAGTPAFMPPEVVRGDSYNGYLADLYSVGATVFCIRFGKPAFMARNTHDLYQKILHDPVRIPVEDGNSENIDQEGPSASVSPGLVSLIKGLMTKSPEVRYTMDRLVHLPWLQTRPDPYADSSLSLPSNSGAAAVVIESECQDQFTTSTIENDMIEVRLTLTDRDVFRSITSMTTSDTSSE